MGLKVEPIVATRQECRREGTYFGLLKFAGAQNSTRKWHRTASMRRLQAKTSRRENIYFLPTES